MAALPVICLGVALLGAILVSISFPSSVANERPVHTLVLAFATSGFALLTLGRTLPSLFRSPQPDRQASSIPLHEQSPTHRKSLSTAYENNVTASPRKSGSILVAAFLALNLRVDVYRRISNATECTIRSVEIFLPLLISLYDARKHRHCSEPDTILQNAVQRGCRIFLRHRFRFIPPALALSTGCYLVSNLWTVTNSTYICPIVVRQATTIPLLQLTALLLDFGLAVAVVELIPQNQKLPSATRSKLPLTTAWILIASASIWSAIGTIVFLAKPDYQTWVLPYDLIFSFGFASSLIAQVVLLSILFISALISTVQYGLPYTSMSLTAICVMIPSARFIWPTSNPFPPISRSGTTLALMLIYFGWWSFEMSRQFLNLEKRHSRFRQAAFFAVILVIILPCWSRHSSLGMHPITGLITNAKSQHQQYLKQAMKSDSLQDAVVEYKRRYSMRPPPGFDIWFEYATNRSATIIDDFDQIYEDLLPFRLTTPADLRRQTWEMVSNPWNEISGITVRAGVAAVQENVLPTHRWMLEGVAILINSFARYLPDMDLAFNLNDESRVAIPYSDLMHLRRQAQEIKLAGFESWSKNRSEGWLPIPEEAYHESAFGDLAFRNTFSKYGSIGCAPNSNARRNPHASSQAHLCLSCIMPHSEGQFLSNWSKAADVCHQPDLAHLHGFYLSPAAFKTSYLPRPVFSQSKPHGFNDILYPSAWNYMDKAIYAPSKDFPDPDYTSKNDVLFWRGATSEGVSSGDHSWRGMTRQRLVHMTNNLTTSTHDYVTILLPKPNGGGFQYQSIPGPSVKYLGLNTDIAIVERIARCGGIGLHDCTDQETEFALVPPSDFQSHWSYRYLFDLDGAGFSGRFLPFMQSKSLPFKTALFREWYDSRLTAWWHFVPQDLRLHGLWSTLAYFKGINGTLSGQKIGMEPHTKEAQDIATAGREWAAKVLRKEDMELYFFRLLLEWGRLTDDNRNGLGFSI